MPLVHINYVFICKRRKYLKTSNAAIIVQRLETLALECMKERKLITHMYPVSIETTFYFTCCK